MIYKVYKIQFSPDAPSLLMEKERGVAVESLPLVSLQIHRSPWIFISISDIMSHRH